MLRSRLAASAGLVLALLLVLLPSLHPDGRAHDGESGLAAYSTSAGSWAHDPDCALCRVTSQVRTALHDPKDGPAPVATFAGRPAPGAGARAPGAPTLRGPRARAPPAPA